MATLSISLSGSGIVNGSKTYTVSDADTQRLLNAVIILYQLDPASTNAQILLAWVQKWIDTTTLQVKQVEATAAAIAAQNGVSSIGIA